jgi:hypothetical protein
MKDMRRQRTEELRVIAKSANAVPAGGITDPGSKHSRKVEISRRGRNKMVSNLMLCENKTILLDLMENEKEIRKLRICRLVTAC